MSKKEAAAEGRNEDDDGAKKKKSGKGRQDSEMKPTANVFIVKPHHPTDWISREPREPPVTLDRDLLGHC